MIRSRERPKDASRLRPCLRHAVPIASPTTIVTNMIPIATAAHCPAVTPANADMAVYTFSTTTAPLARLQSTLVSSTIAPVGTSGTHPEATGRCLAHRRLAAAVSQRDNETVSRRRVARSCPDPLLQSGTL